LVTTAELDEILGILSYIEAHQDEFIFAWFTPNPDLTKLIYCALG
jgi:hypothetical protein